MPASVLKVNDALQVFGGERGDVIEQVALDFRPAVAHRFEIGAIGGAGNRRWARGHASARARSIPRRKCGKACRARKGSCCRGRA